MGLKSNLLSTQSYTAATAYSPLPRDHSAKQLYNNNFQLNMDDLFTHREHSSIFQLKISTHTL